MEGQKTVLPKDTQFYTQKQKTYQMETIQGFSVDLVLEILGFKKNQGKGLQNETQKFEIFEAILSFGMFTPSPSKELSKVSVRS